MEHHKLMQGRERTHHALGEGEQPDFSRRKGLPIGYRKTTENPEYENKDAQAENGGGGLVGVGAPALPDLPEEVPQHILDRDSAYVLGHVVASPSFVATVVGGRDRHIR